MTAIEKIRAEIERRMDKHWEGLPNADSPEDDWTHNELCELGAYKELEHLETFLDTLEEEPVNLEEEIERVLEDSSFRASIDSGGFTTTVLDYQKIARHFYELGRKRNDT